MPAEAGWVHLTFDDGPDPLWTPRILDILAQANVRATFFLIGRFAFAQAEHSDRCLFLTRPHRQYVRVLWGRLPERRNFISGPLQT